MIIIMATVDGATREIGTKTFGYDALENEWIPIEMWEARRLPAAEFTEAEGERCRDSLFLFNCYPVVLKALADASSVEEAQKFLGTWWTGDNGLYTLEQFLMWPSYLLNWLEIAFTLMIGAPDNFALLPHPYSLQYEDMSYETIVWYKKLSLDIMFMGPVTWDGFEELNPAAWAKLDDKEIEAKIMAHSTRWAFLAAVYLFIDISIVTVAVLGGYYGSQILYTFGGSLFV